ncbi:hypothetical protein Tco_1446808 [Tanacetum coccineum]
MVGYLEKTDGNAEFHEIIDFLTRSSIHYALTVSHVVSTTFVEQFWMIAKSKTINKVRYITATVAGKPVSISEASIRSDLQFNDAAGIDNVTSLFPSMLAQPTEDEGAVLERPSETQPTPSPTHPSEDQSKPQPDPFLKPSSSNLIPDSILDGSRTSVPNQYHYGDFPVNVIEQVAVRSGMDSKMAELTMSSPNRSTSDIEDAFSSMNILNYTSVSSDYFPASSGSSSFNSSENSTDNMIPPVFSSFYNNPCLKDVQAFYAKESPILSPDPIASPAILTPSPILPPSLLFDPRYFFVPEELLPPKKQIHSPSSSSTTLFNSSRNQIYNLVSPSSSVYTPTPPQIFEIGKCSIKMYLKHHEEQIEDILNYLEELSFHRIEKMEEGRINGNELKTELKEIRTQIIKLQKKRLGQKDKIAFAHYRISDLERIIEKTQAYHQTNQEDL